MPFSSDLTIPGCRLSDPKRATRKEPKRESRKEEEPKRGGAEKRTPTFDNYNGLAQDIADGRPSIYLDLENIADRGKLENPDLFLEQHEDELVVLDEIHRVPEIFGSLRGIIDRGRRKGKRTGRFLVLGSAAIELLRQSETLAGRIAYVDLTPLHALEIGSKAQDLNRLWVRGVFPDSYLATDDDESF